MGRVQPWTAWVGAELRAFRRDVRGALAITLGFFMALLLSMAVLALDVGRMIVVQTQMQHAADAAALAAALQLTGAPGAMTLAETVARNAAQQTSEFPLGATVNLSVNTVQFYQDWTPGNPGTGTPATDDQNANVVKVTLNAQTLELVMQPVLNVLTEVTNAGTTVHTASAVAQQSVISCRMTPLMMCNPMEDPANPCSYSGNVYDSQHIGKMLIMKAGPGNTPDAPGEFGLLEVPGGGAGAGSANTLGPAMADSSGLKCNDPTVTTAPGSKTQQIMWGVLTRFGTSPKYTNDPAPNVGNFPKDDNVGAVNLYLGNGHWDPTSYISNNTTYVSAPPFTPVQTIPGSADYPTRYQMYLWEIGVEFLVYQNITIYPMIDTAEAESLTNIPAGDWTTINMGASTPTVSPSTPPDIDNVATPTNIRGDDDDVATAIDQDDSSSYAGTDDVGWVKRRNFTSAVLDCGCLGVAGAGTYANAGHIIELFITQEPQGGGAVNDDVNMWAEYLGAPLTGFGSQQDIVRNVQLIE